VSDLIVSPCGTFVTPGKLTATVVVNHLVWNGWARSSARSTSSDITRAARALRAIFERQTKWSRLRGRSGLLVRAKDWLDRRLRNDRTNLRVRDEARSALPRSTPASVHARAANVPPDERAAWVVPPWLPSTDWPRWCLKARRIAQRERTRFLPHEETWLDEIAHDDWSDDRQCRPVQPSVQLRTLGSHARRRWLRLLRFLPA
jgi:hypothetical protein